MERRGGGVDSWEGRGWTLGGVGWTVWTSAPLLSMMGWEGGMVSRGGPEKRQEEEEEEEGRMR